jgi:hypothetical protein
MMADGGHDKVFAQHQTNKDSSGVSKCDPATKVKSEIMLHVPSDNDSSAQQTAIEIGIGIEIPGLPSYLKCHTTPSAGRTVVTTKQIRKGETAFAQVPYAHTIHYRHKTTTCDACFLFTSHDDEDESLPLQYPCEKSCGVYYCSMACRDASSSRRHGCALLRQVKVHQQQEECKKRNKSMHSALSLLTSMHANDTDRPVSDVLLMMKDSSTASMKKNILAETQFRRILQSLPSSGDISSSSSLQQQEEEIDNKKGVYAQALATVKLNALGMYNEVGEEIGYALSPAMAMVNHSCLPNCQQVTTKGKCRLIARVDIPIGQELSYSYVSLIQDDIDSTASSISSSTERKRLIRKNWEFTCACPRCRNLKDCRAFDAEHTCYCGAVCLQVDRSTGSCICNPPMVVVVL